MNEHAEPSDDRPYLINPQDDNRVVIRFANICDHELHDQWKDELSELVQTQDQIACDLSSTSVLVSGWIRLLEGLAIEAEHVGKRFCVVSPSDAVRKSADLIGSSMRLTYVLSIDEAWSE